MNIKVIAYLAIASNYVNSTIAVNSRISKLAISRSSSAPDLRVLYNTTASATAMATTYTTASASASASAYSTYNDANNIISYEQYKSIIYNKYKRNIYLRSKEKYSFDLNK